MATALYVLSTGFGARRDAAKLPMWRDALRPAAVEVFVVEVGEVWVEGADAACVAALSAAVEANAARTFARQVLLAQSRGAWHAVAALEQRCWVDAVILISSTADPRDVHRAASSGAPVVWLHGSLDGTAASGDGGAGLAADYVVGELAKLDTACMAVSVIEGDGHLLESLRDPTKLCDTILGAVAQCAALEAEVEAEEAEDAAEGAGAAAAAGAAEDGDEEDGYSLRDLDAERKVLMLFVRFDEDCDARLSYAEFDAFQRATEEGAGLPIEMWHGICGMLECSPHEGMSLGDLLAIYTDEGLVAQLQTDVHADHRAIFGPTGRYVRRDAQQLLSVPTLNSHPQPSSPHPPLTLADQAMCSTLSSRPPIFSTASAPLTPYPLVPSSSLRF